MHTIVVSTSSRIPSKALSIEDLSTAEVVELLGAEGWSPVRASQQRVRLENREGFLMHEPRFARRVDLENEAFAIGDTRPELILQNAHDGTRAYRIDAGLYRLVCRNGLTVADAQFAHVAIRHVDVSADKFVTAAHAVAEGAPRVLEVVARWRSVQLSVAARQDFARRAIALRWAPEQNATRLLTPDKLLAPVRHGDRATDLWITFNVVQEHTTRPVVSLTEGQRLNKALWALAEEFSRN